MYQVQQTTEFKTWLDNLDKPVRARVLMLGGGDKSTQQNDILRALQLAKTLGAL